MAATNMAGLSLQNKIAQQFSTPPKTADPALSPFKVSIPDEQVTDLKRRIAETVIAKPAWENSQEDRRFGVTRDWLVGALKVWGNEFDWRRQEERINSVPHFKIPIEEDGEHYDVHFAALFSQKPDATPLLLMHGWPGSFIEFLPILLNVRDQYSSNPSTLPYHIIVPSLPGYGFSSYTQNKDFNGSTCANIFNKLMIKLGFQEGYIVQGGDVGAFLVQDMTSRFPEVKAGHTNMLLLGPPEGEIHEEDKKEMERWAEFHKTGFAYAMLHGTKPSTAGLALAASPASLLAWIGEKMLAWSDVDPSLETILLNVSIYWFTGCYPTSIWIYRRLFDPKSVENSKLDTAGKPFGYSRFPREIRAPTRQLAESTGLVTFVREHKKGGHFAALEQPDLLWQDVEEFVAAVKREGKI